MAKEENAAHWHTIIGKQGDSGLSGAAYCRKHDINLSRFYWWRGRFQRENGNVPSVGFVEVLQTPGILQNTICFHLKNGVAIEVAKGFDPVTLRQVIETAKVL